MDEIKIKHSPGSAGPMGLFTPLGGVLCINLCIIFQYGGPRSVLFIIRIILYYVFIMYFVLSYPEEAGGDAGCGKG